MKKKEDEYLNITNEADDSQYKFDDSDKDLLNGNEDSYNDNSQTLNELLEDVGSDRKKSKKKGVKDKAVKNGKKKKSDNSPKKDNTPKIDKKTKISELLPENKKYFTVQEIDDYYRNTRKRKKGVQKTPKRDRPFFYYLSPLNFATESRLAGVSAKLTSLSTQFLIMIIIAVAIAYFYKLNWAYSAPLLILASVLFVPKNYVLDTQKKYEMQRVNDLHTYMEQMLYAFKQNQNIKDCLISVMDMFSEDCMIKQAMQEAIDYIENSMSETATEDALGIIESYYHNDRLSSVHKLLLKVEAIGGDCEKSINLLLDDLKLWRTRLETHSISAAGQRRNIRLACIITMGLCAVIVLTMSDQLDLMTNKVYQVSTVAAAFFLLFIDCKANAKTNVRWIENNDKYTEEELLQRYEKYETFDMEEAKKTSLKWALISGITVLGLGAAFVATDPTKYPVVALVLAGVELIMLNQHKISYNLNEKVLKKEITKAFPKWLMEIALRMQTENVQISIIDSLENSPAVLKPALRQLVEDIQQNPESMIPYSKFLKDFEMTDVASAMKMLYAIFSGKGGDSDDQIAELISRNNAMLNQSEILALDDAMGGFYMLFLAPTLVGALKIMVDMMQVLGALMSRMTVS